MFFKTNVLTVVGYGNEKNNAKNIYFFIPIVLLRLDF